VAKRLDKIRNSVDNEADQFFDYLTTTLDKEIIQILSTLSGGTKAYIFSGIIRDYFLRRDQKIRDVDVVVESEDILQPILKTFEYKKNSYGGYKIKTESVDIDLWSIQKTWALNNVQATLNFELAKYIPTTSFFNFSAVLYSLNDKQFYYSKHFLNFLRDKKIDVVFEPNANYQLCIVNSFYYSDRYKMKLSEQLKKLIKKLFNREDKEFSKIQQKHFGRIIYSNDEIERRVKAISI
jgi:hypothetical protein